MANLVFNKVGVANEATYTSEGNAIVQLERAENGWVRVEIKLTGATDYAVIGAMDGDKNVSFGVNVPSGVSVKIVSESAVTNAIRVANE